MASISEILLAQGRHAAESKRARAGAWQPLMRHLANLPGQVMRDRAAERAATETAFDRQQQRDVREQTLAKGEQELQAGTRMGELLATPGVIGDDGRFDVTAAQRFATEKGYTDILDDILPLARDHNDAVDKGLLTQEQINAARRRAKADDAALKQTATEQGVRQIIGARMGAGPLTDAGRSELQGMAYANAIAAPAFPEPEKFTYGQLQNLMVNGTRTPVRTRSDGAVVDLKNNIVQDAQSDVGPPSQSSRGGAGSGGYSDAIESKYRTALDRAILNIPATRRGSVVALANRLADEGNTDGLKDVIRQAAIETENVDTKNQVTGRMATLASLRDARAILQEMKTKGVPTNMLSGTAEDVARKLGTSTNPEYVALANRLQGTLINYRRAATGAAFGEREGSDYAKMFPNYRNTFPVNDALIAGLEREMTTYDRVYWEHKLGKDGAALVGMGGSGGGSGGGGADPMGLR